jgi:hypothetical protein
MVPRSIRFPSRHRLRMPAGCLAGLATLAVLLGSGAPSPAASPLLESVKQNPKKAQELCARFKQFNAQGQSATSKASIAQVAASEGLAPGDAEVLITYVIGLHCPDVH